MVVNHETNQLAQATQGLSTWRARAASSRTSATSPAAQASPADESSAGAGATATPACDAPSPPWASSARESRGARLQPAQPKLAASVFERLRAQHADRDAGPASPAAEGFPRVPVPAYAPTITRRERQILQAIADGSTNEFIAYQLGISAETVKTHVANLLSKLHAANRAHAVSIGFRMGIIR